MSDSHVPTPDRHLSGAAQALALVVVGIVVGSTLAWTLLLGDVEAAAPWIDGALRYLFPVFSLFIALLAVMLPIAIWVATNFVKNARGTVAQVISELASTSRAIIVNDEQRAILHLERAVHEAVAWYVPISVRGWIVRTFLALMITFGGMVGTALLFRQNILLGKQNEKLQEQTALLRDQNRKLDLQTVTAEAQRRFGLSTELFSILAAISKAKPKELEEAIKGRIVALSRAATPYWTVEVAEPEAGKPRTPVLASRARSPERGQLLVAVVAAGIPIRDIKGAIFDGADLREASLNGADLSGVSLIGADLTHAELRNANLTGAILESAEMSYATLLGAQLSGAVLDGVIIGYMFPGASVEMFSAAWPNPLPADYIARSWNKLVMIMNKKGPPARMHLVMPPK